MSLLSQLNEEQKEAVQCVDSHLRIIAGAGSGKTRVVTTRIAYLIDELHVYPNKVLAITFTNKAAREMKERVETFLHERAHAVQISTIHSFCVRFLREDITVLGYPRNFTIIDSDDQKSILKDAYKQMSLDVKTYSYQSMLSYISNNKSALVSVEQAYSYASSDVDTIRAKVYAFYQEKLHEMYALDFDDLLLFTYRILKSHEDVKKKWQNRFTYLHVDEFQDVDMIQYQIIKMLVKDDSYLCVVGDPDQTIYTWRGAQVDIILNFEKDFLNSKTVYLNQNYRSTQPILDAANALIKNNRNRLDKDLFTTNEGEHRLTHYTAMDEDEADWVAMKILGLKNEHVAYPDIAVLYRSNYLSRSLEKAFRNFHIPYRIYGGIRFYDRAEIKDSLSYLRLLVDGIDGDEKALFKNLAVKRIINMPKRGIGDKTLELVELKAIQEQMNMYDAMKYFELGKGKAKQNIKQFIDTVEYHKQMLESVSVDKVLDSLLSSSGYFKMLEDDKEVERIENIKELMSDIVDYMKEHEHATLIDYLQEISLYTDKEEEAKNDCVQLMSIHAAKGLEFDHVFVYNFCEGVFPSERSLQEGGNQALEEERRLAYVAFTRAKKRLFISDSYGYSYVLDKVKTKSRFFDEIPSECFEGHQKIKRSTHDVSEGMSGMQFLSQYQSKKLDSSSSTVKKKGKIRKGDLIVHDTFGDGVVIQLENDLATIAFEQQYGIRKIKVDHPSIRKK